jgi:ferredoxin
MSTTLSGPEERSLAETTHGEPIRANAWGAYYVTGDCDGCGLCYSYAPDSFGTTPDGMCYGVMHQPIDEDEERALRAAMAACPRHCIYDDGDTD